ncbi:hypothetical protein [Streptosporangium lutulentum]|uniref:Uncharacterized protein n=1 Tax=Streptosporangium lutulentum TaxID=1461250 RepID=A0ABT9Q5G4_9ACTN|nr:hypothetical protein [Streptosporangium lutulentum]MDP9841980.1 hypothetical protein [Streptosporangium lutulentum]
MFRGPVAVDVLADGLAAPYTPLTERGPDFTAAVADPSGTVCDRYYPEVLDR